MLRIFGHFVPSSALILLLTEVVLIAAIIQFSVPGALEHAAWIAAHASAESSYVLAFPVLLAMAGIGLYNYDVFSDYRMMAIKIVVAFALAMPIVVICAYFMLDLSTRATATGWWLWYAKAAVAWFACVMVARTTFVRVAGADTFKHRVVVIGSGYCAGCIKRLADQQGCRFVAVAFVASPAEATRGPDAPLRLESDSSPDALLSVVRRHRATEVVLATDDRRGVPVLQLLRCKTDGIKVTDYLSFWERETGRVDLESLQPSWLIFSDGFRAGSFTRFFKRTFDILVSSIFLIIALPLLLIVAILTKLESPGAVLYRQERVGLRGKPFTLLKIRSMRSDAESEGRPQWAAQGDQRVTRVGAIIRKIRIDELPQLLNVLKGDMSFVGPRPERPYFVEQLNEKIRFYNERHSVKPGITGWAQINYPYGASIEDARNKLSYDLYYAKNHTLFLDLVILIQTVRVILFPSGAR